MAFNYKLLIIIPIALQIFAVSVIMNHYLVSGEFFERAIDLKGGTAITVTSGPVDINSIKSSLSAKFGTVNIREFRGISGTGIIVEFDTETDSDGVIQELKSLGIDTRGSSIESVNPALGEAFWIQGQIGIILAFIMMGVIVFILFRTFVPSLAVILSATSDILVTLSMMLIFNIEVSLAAIAALLMLIGYSVDTDIMLTSRLLKTRGSGIPKKIKSAFKTGITMTLTSVVAITAILLSSISPVLAQIASILLMGLLADLVFTWCQNSVILRWYCERRHIGDE